MQLIPKNVAGGLSLLDIAEIAVTKLVSERLLSGFIGNGTVMSGAVKGVGGLALSQIDGKHAKLIAAGMLVDAVEDLAISINPFGLFARAGTAQNADAGILRI